MVSGSVIEFRLCHHWFHLQGWISRIHCGWDLIRSKQLCFRMSCVSIRWIFWSWWFYSQYNSSTYKRKEFQVYNLWSLVRSPVVEITVLLMRPKKVEAAVQCFRKSCVGVRRIFWSRWFYSQYNSSTYKRKEFQVYNLWSLVRSPVVEITVLLMRPKKVEAAVQCFRKSCVGVRRIFWSRWFYSQYNSSTYKRKEFQVYNLWSLVRSPVVEIIVLPMRPKKVETAVQCFRMSCVGVRWIFWSWEFNS